MSESGVLKAKKNFVDNDVKISKNKVKNQIKPYFKKKWQEQWDKGGSVRFYDIQKKVRLYEM